MPIPSSGAITADQIMAEFGGGRPFNISSYYAGGAYVPSGTQGIPSGSWVNIPTSGAISFANFRGAAKRVYYRVTANQNITVPVGVRYVSGHLAGGGGGGGGGPDDSDHGRGGGGGAGALISFSNRGVSAGQNLAVTIGAGGRGGKWGRSEADKGVNGNPSYFHGLTALGGGGGGGVRDWVYASGFFMENDPRLTGRDGACGGGAGNIRRNSVVNYSAKGSVGGDGGIALHGNGNGRGGGGGGMGGRGNDGGNSNGQGGVGKLVSLAGTPIAGGVWLCGGGSGAYYGGTGVAGGNGGGGKGGNTYTDGAAGAANTGGGGGGGGESKAGGTGGSGVLYCVFHN